MKIAIRITLDVDVDEWIEAFGVEKSDVREDVKEYVINGIRNDMPALIEATDR